MAEAMAVELLLFVVGLWALATLRLSKPSKQAEFWASFPTAGVSSGVFFPWSLAAFRSITASADMATEGYNKFCKKRDIPFALPSTGVGAIVALPPSQLHVLNKSEKHVIAAEAQSESIQPKYMIGDRELYENSIHFDIVRKHMTKDVGFFAAGTAEELDAAFRDCWGADSQNWTTVGAWDTLSRAVARAVNRAYVGLPLCRNETLLEQSRLYANAVYMGSALITAMPKCTRPALGPLIALPAKRYLAGCKRVLVPLVEERLRRWDGGKAGEKMPDDALQWMVERCAKVGPGQMEPAGIAQRLLILNLVSIYTTSYAFTNCVLDLHGSESRDDFVAGLRRECDGVAAELDGLVTGKAIDKLFRVDSAVRESMRISCFGIISLPRIVGPGQALDLGSDIKIPPGVRLGIPSQAIHRDASYYDDPLRYDAFRFSRDFESPDGAGRQAAGQKRSVDVSSSFLTYGFGKHACPGRWFASQLMKQALAYIVQNYEVECVGKTQEKKALLNMIMPPVSAKIRVRLLRGQHC
ncbi:cytochrome p450 [Hirsutella rhossiliensis]|uniref:Cytochrome p450 domain-containing protein n=1 Tax=Hirsutella rhossiliensis TaxID=111463 RepID=A0A9P8N1D9_9HYPO|nr:cytochrome p450 domain-containing protein [Hirsutella rhossiliensis]KAH0965085.1 cytochrome p450 domain-containing protein [Hirsutella rhossiliensis]